jgi:hypothetical protein
VLLASRLNCKALKGKKALPATDRELRTTTLDKVTERESERKKLLLVQQKKKV